MAKIAADRDAEWQSNREEKGASTSRKTTGVEEGSSKQGNSSPSELEFIEPMKAKLAEAPPTKGDWIYELKFDGFRALALKSGDSVEILSRNNKDLGRKFPELIKRARSSGRRRRSSMARSSRWIGGALIVSTAPGL
jgi:bifunctional non-homologous end joining protein LigD